VTVVDSFVLVNADGGANYAAAVTLARRAVDAFYAGRFEEHPPFAVTVFVFSDEAAYQRFCGGACATQLGGYDRKTRTIVLHATKGAETLLHEMGHALAHADWLHANGAHAAPFWLDEAVSSAFEAPRFCGKEDVTGVDNWRHGDALAALDHPDEPAPTRLQALFSMDTATFTTIDPKHLEDGPTDRAKELRHIGLARYFALWMDRGGWLWPFWRRWMRDFAGDRTGEKTFAAVVGKGWAEAEAHWERYVREVVATAKDRPCPR
jgi:hypothetical protein